MKAILIDAVNKRIEEVEHNGTLQGVYELVSCDLVDRFYVGRECVYIDDEGLYNSPNVGFYYNGYLYRGNGLVVGTNLDDGSDSEVEMSLEDAKKLFSFPVCKDEKYLLTLFEEKGIALDEKVNGIVSVEELMRYIAISEEKTQEKIVQILRNIDFTNGDVRHFLNYMANNIS